MGRTTFGSSGYVIHKVNCVHREPSSSNSNNHPNRENNHNVNRSTGFAFIDFNDPNAADGILAENGGDHYFTVQLTSNSSKDNNNKSSSSSISISSNQSEKKKKV